MSEAARHHPLGAYAALRDKYAEMSRMRREHADGLAHDPRDEMRALARRFPGALREIDELPLEVIEARVRTLDEVAAGRDAPPEWATYFVDYHGWLRAALRIKRACLGCDGVEAAVERVRAAYRPEPDEPPAELVCDRAVVQAIVRPSGGRLNRWVFARVAELHGVSPAHVRRALFPHSSAQ